MIPAHLTYQLHDLDAEQLRMVIALADGLHADRDKDNGETTAAVLRRIADRITRQPKTGVAA